MAKLSGCTTYYNLVRGSGEEPLPALCNGPDVRQTGGGGEVMLPPVRMRVTNVSNGRILARRVWVALALWDRVRGLARLPKLAEGDGFVVQPCHIAHTIGLGYAVDAHVVCPCGFSESMS